MLQEYFEQLCDSFKDAVCITDRHGIIRLLNKRHSELTGIPRSDLLGKPVTELRDQGIFDVVLNPEIVQTKLPVTRVQHVENGRQLIIDGIPLCDTRGEVAFVVTFIRDNTTLSELRLELAAQKELLEAFQQINKAALQKEFKYPRIVQSASMRKLYAGIEGIAGTDATVLLLGETGVGKDVVARRVHAESPRKDNPFVKVDCGSIPENLIETELFGYAPGTFSGGNKNGKPGIIEAASTGTLFLDEIGELPMNMQSRLLRLLQDREVVRVGSTSPKGIDVRIVAATNRDLEKEVAKGRFRTDLYYRLKVAVLKIPPLRNRQADILPLARAFLQFYCQKYDRTCRFSPAAEQILLAYNWPGNVRELENLVQGLVVTGKSPLVDARDIPIARHVAHAFDTVCPAEPDIDFDGKSYREIMKELEGTMLKAALKRYGTITKVALHLQVDRSTIFRKVKEMEEASLNAASVLPEQKTGKPGRLKQEITN